MNERSESLLLTPYFQTEVGIVFFRIPPTVSPSDFGERTLLQPAPTALQTKKSGKVTHFSANPTACQALIELAKSEKVRKLVNTRRHIYAYGDLPYTRYVKQIQTCQCRDGQYCHPEKVLAETENGLVQLCWHHDKMRIEGEISAQELIKIADQNWLAFISQCVRSKLHKANDAPIEFSDVILWACLMNVFDLLNYDDVRKFLGYGERLDQSKESSIGFSDPDEVATLVGIAENLKLKVDPEPPASFMAIPKLKRFENRKWLQFVKSQPCVCCGATADDPHHIIGHGGGKMGGVKNTIYLPFRFVVFIIMNYTEMLAVLSNNMAHN